MFTIFFAVLMIYLPVLVFLLAIFYVSSEVTREIKLKINSTIESDFKYIIFTLVSFSTVLIFTSILTLNDTGNHSTLLYSTVFGVCIVSGICKGMLNKNDKTLNHLLSFQLTFLPLAIIIIAFKSPINFNF